MWCRAYASAFALAAAQMARLVFRAMHYLDGYGVSRNSANTQMNVTAPGESVANVATTPDTERPTIIAAGAGV